MGATIEGEKRLDKLQVFLIYLRAGITGVINIGSKLRYTSGPTFNNPLDIPTKSYVDNATQGLTVGFTATGSTWPLSYNTAVAPYAAYFAYVPDVIIREITASGVYRERKSIEPVYNSNLNTYTIDEVPFDGDITFK